MSLFCLNVHEPANELSDGCVFLFMGSVVDGMSCCSCLSFSMQEREKRGRWKWLEPSLELNV